MLLECSDLDLENPKTKAQLSQFTDCVQSPVIIISATRLRIGNNLTPHNIQVIARDRHANQEVGYVLQRLESYSGLAILTTNLPNAMDSAFERRIRFSVRSEMPNQEQHTEILTRLLRNRKLPVEGLHPELLGQLNFLGASIRMIAENASFLAAEDKTSVLPTHLIAAARSESLKQEQGLTDRELQGWPR